MGMSEGFLPFYTWLYKSNPFKAEVIKMKKRISRIITFVLAFSLCLTFGFLFSSCEEKKPEKSEQTVETKTEVGVSNTDAENNEQTTQEVSQKDLRYKAFADKVREYETKYGEGNHVTVDEYFRYTMGLSLIKLVDFKGDGNEDLLLVYHNNPQTVLENHYAEYVYEIWSFEDEKAVLLDQGGLLGSDGGVTNVLLNERDGKWYLVTGSSGSFGYFTYRGYTDKGFGVVQTIEYDDFGGEGSGLLDGEEVPMEEINKVMDAWGESDYSKNFMDDGKAILKENQKTKDLLFGAK